MIIKETYKILNKHLPKVEIEKPISNVILFPTIPELEEPTISVAELVDTFKSLRCLTKKSTENLKFRDKDHAFLVKGVGVLHYSGLYLDNFNTQELYTIMLRISDYIKDNDYILLSNENIFKVVDDFTRDIKTYLSGVPLNIFSYPDKVTEWSRREVPLVINKYNDISSEPFTAEHEAVDYYEGVTIYATKDGIVNIIKYLVENLSYMYIQ